MFFDKHRFSAMFHVKHLYIFVLTLVISFNLFTVNALADGNSNLNNITSNNYSVSYVTVQINDYTEIFLCYSQWGGIKVNSNSIESTYGTLLWQLVPEIVNLGENYYYSSSGGGTLYYHPISVVYVQGGLTNNANVESKTLEEYFTPDPWYKTLWNNFIGELDRENTALQEAMQNLGKMISRWWQRITGNIPEHDGIHGKYGVAYIATPTPFPTPTPKPTPIPYSTVIKNDGQGNSTIVYQYNNPEGTPTESPVNPNINYNYNNSININGGDRNNPIYVQDVGNPEFTSIIDLSDNTISVNIGNLDDSIDAFTDPLSSNVEDVGKISDIFSVFPDDIMITIGCIACISLVAGIIGRFLK